MNGREKRQKQVDHDAFVCSLVRSCNVISLQNSCAGVFVSLFPRRPPPAWLASKAGYHQGQGTHDVLQMLLRPQHRVGGKQVNLPPFLPNKQFNTARPAPEPDERFSDHGAQLAIVQLN